MNRKIKTGLTAFIYTLISFVAAEAQKPSPVITLADGLEIERCGNNPFFLKISPFNNTGLQYNWEYGVKVSYKTEVNPFFNAFLDNVCIALRQNNEYNDYVDIDGIIYCVKSLTDYSFLRDYLYLYDDLDNTKHIIINKIILEIISQNLPFLDPADIQFIYSYFTDAAKSPDSFPPPFNRIPTDVRSLYITYFTSFAFVQTEDANVKFDPQTIFPEGLEGKKTITFRARANDTGSGLHGDWSDYLTLDIKPAPPTALISVTDSACTNIKSPVTIRISEIESSVFIKDYTYRIVKDGETGGDPISFSGTEISINDTFKSGSYKLFLTYDNTAINNCLDPVPFKIEPLPELKYIITADSVKCPGESSGSIVLRITDGAGSKYVIKNGTKANYTQPYLFSGLNQGSYTVEFGDLCYDKSVNISVPQPKPVVIDLVTSRNPTCLSPSNGGFKVYASGLEGNAYDYYIYNSINYPAGASIIAVARQGPVWEYYSLPAGSYTIVVKDHNHPNCTGAIKTFQVLNDVAPLKIASVGITKVLCNGANTGEIKVSATGGIDKYTFNIGSDYKQGLSGDIITFKSLSAGNHIVYVHNETTGCNDVASETAAVESNKTIDITLTPSNINCYGEGNGKINTVVTGGTAIYNYKWETKENLVWKAYTSFSANPANLDPGDYRLTVTDNANCSVISEETTINQPAAPLTITSVISQDIKCKGETGKINIMAAGGNGGYSYSYKSGALLYENKPSEYLLPAGIYTLNVKDSKGCVTYYEDEYSETIEVKITEPEDALSFTTTLSDYNGYNISCNGNGNGTILVNATGGNGDGPEGLTYNSYQYFLAGEKQSNNNLTTLTASTYNISVTDGRGCSVSRNISLTQPEELKMKLIAKDDIKCYGTETGKISVSASGGAGGVYSYKLENQDVGSSGEFKNLGVKLYHINLRDLNNCQQNLEVDIAQTYGEIKVNLTSQDVTCYGEENGSINSIITGGSGSYDLLWEQKTEGKWQSKKSGVTDLTSLTSGSYRFNITDTIGCPTVSDSVIIDQPDGKLKIEGVTAHDIRCYGETGSIEMYASGGNDGGYNYFYSMGEIIYEPFTAGTSLTAGDYNVVVSDTKGCKTEWAAPVTITAPNSPLNFKYSLSDYNGYNISCYGNNNGSISVSPLGGNGSYYEGYTFSLQSDKLQSDSIFTSLTAGNYQLTLSDERGCSVSKSISLTQSSSPINLSIGTISDTKCFNDSTGKIILNVSGGNGPFEYKKAGGNYVPGNEFDNLPSGSYIFTVKDRNGCAQTIDTSIRNLYSEPIVTFVTKDISCYQKNDGSIQASIAGGSGSFDLKWFSKQLGVLQYFKSDSVKVASLNQGDYVLEITDNAGCPAFQKSATVYERVSPLIIDSVTIKDIVCFGDSGSIDIKASGGNSEYVYQFSKDNLSYENYVPGSLLPAASYSLRVKDKKGCITGWPEKADITQPPESLAFTYTLKDYNGYNVSCFGNNDGEINIKVTGGNGDGYTGYQYLLSGRDPQSNSLFKTLTAGNYNISVTDGRGCNVSEPVKLEQAVSKIKLWPENITEVKCYYDSIGTIELASSGGAGPYMYRIENDSYTSEKTFSDLKAGSYRFTVKDANGCLQYFDTAIINTVSRMEISGITENVKCFGQNTGSISVNIVGGAKPYSLNWKEISSSAAGITGLFKGSFTLSATDSAGCKSEQRFEIKEPSLPLYVSATAQSACAQKKDGVISIEGTGGTAPYKFSIDNPSEMKNETKFLTYGGHYKVYITDSNNCKAETEATVNVRNIMPAVNFMVATSRYASDTLVIKDVSLPRPDSVRWWFSTDADIISYDKFQSVVKYNETGTYPIKMIGYFETCDYTIDKLLNIAPFDSLVINSNKEMSGIENVEISPNPNAGQFRLTVKLYKKQKTVVRIMDLYSKLWYSSQNPEGLGSEETINISGAPSGTYIIWVITDTDFEAKLFIISQ